MASNEWPVYGGDRYHTACTDERGPTEGTLDWTVPIGVGWYASPTVDDGHVYLTSPGIRTMAYCLDVETGDRVWTTRRHENLPEGWTFSGSHGKNTTPAAASTPRLSGDRVILNEMGAQGTNNAERHLLYVDPDDGTVTKRVPAGHLDYRAGYARLACDDDLVVYPDGEHEINAVPPRITPQNRIVCKDADTGETYCDFTSGPVFCDPVIHDGLVYVGTRDGVFFCLDPTSDGNPIEWQFTTNSAVTTTATVCEETVYFGTNDGRIRALNKDTGDVRWSYEVEDTNPRAFKFFSPMSVGEDRLLVGDANGLLHCLDRRTGTQRWTYEAPDWIRSKPVDGEGNIYFADMDGTVHCVQETDGDVESVWEQSVTDHPILADLAYANGVVLGTSTDLFGWCLDAGTGERRWRHSLLECIYEDGQRVKADEIACGAFFQSKPTVAEDTVFIGTHSRFVHALDHETGERQWRFELGAAVSGAPAYSNGRVFVGQQGGEDDFYCIDAEDGTPQWAQALGWVWSSANVYEDQVYVPTVNGDFFCLDATDGTIQWRHRTAGGAHPEPPIDEERVYFGSWDGYIYAFDIETLDLDWKFYTSGAPDSGTPIAYERRIYVPAAGAAHAFRCLDSDTGERIWEHHDDGMMFNASAALQPHEDRLFVPKSQIGNVPIATNIVSMDATDGSENWTHPGGGLTSPAVADDLVYFGSTAGPYFYCVDAAGNADGTTDCLWKYKMGDRMDESVPAIYDGRVYALGTDGFLYAFT